MVRKKLFPDLLPSVADSFIGFDKLFTTLEQLEKIDRGGSCTFPRYNIIQCDDESCYVVQLAVAGYSEKDIEIAIENGKLIVTGNAVDDYPGNHTHKGITTKRFERVFALNDQAVVDGAKLVNGILTISVHIEIPEIEKRKTIPIGNSNDPQLLVEGKDGK